jgi:hypothetical protein
MSDKPRLVEVTDAVEYEAIMRRAGHLDVPSITESSDGRIWADADELRAWREGYTTTSGEKL